MKPTVLRNLRYLATVPLAIAALTLAARLGFSVPNTPLALFLPLAYCAYRTGLVGGLVGAAMHVIYSAIFLSEPGHLFHYQGDELFRVLIIAVVAPATATMLGALRREADKLLIRQKATERDLVRLNAELEARIALRTAEFVEAHERAEAMRIRAELNEERFRDFAETASDWLWEQDEHLRYVYVSEGLLKTGRAPAAVIGKTRSELAPLGVSDEQRRRHEAEIAARHPFQNFQFQRRTNDGSVRHISLSGRPLFDADGVFRGYRGAGRDVTREAESELRLEQRVEQRTAELRAAQAELLRSERFATLGQVTASVSHELRNPLSTIRNTLFTVRQMAASQGATLERPFTRIEHAVARCDLIIAELLDYTRVRELKPQLITFDQWLSEVVDELTVVPSGVTVSKALGAGATEVSVDPDRFRQVMINLIENAAQAIAGADVPPAEKRITVRTGIDHDDLTVVVEDTGPGVSPEHLEKIFEPLFSTKNLGTGLGLPTVKRIVEQHGGSIHLESEPGHRTQAIIRLKLTNVGSDVRSEASSPGLERSRKLG